ncbi:hypothetical protein ASPZODRAFT_134979 [Penicilliopsis zonata CBS 506.65]|uniref:Type 1 phosphatases regulator n=1 Tax=Penicilliopsis zonata CBS 506.65 TaxID=1073090 RepID=A0A1L9SCG2_9EURO|nr:hypothetical protein ASPZODRAFT_134979 [Penicilliopsis zonata CBS 506.65]OJJ44833.1 hypothetical protein ASPZODRAFT_134979 [Penicilliopsis zonata CBS 506.65]
MSQTRPATLQARQTPQVQTATESESRASTVRISGNIILRGEENLDSIDADERAAAGRHIRWSEDVVDNEGMGKKSSKVCCIYHKSRPVGESSSESESSDSDTSDTDNDDGDVHRCEHDPGYSHHSNHRDGRRQAGRKQSGGRNRKPSPNAYEKMPRPSDKANP